MAQWLSTLLPVALLSKGLTPTTAFSPSNILSHARTPANNHQLGHPDHFFCQQNSNIRANTKTQSLQRLSDGKMNLFPTLQSESFFPNPINGKWIITSPKVDDSIRHFKAGQTIVDNRTIESVLKSAEDKRDLFIKMDNGQIIHLTQEDRLELIALLQLLDIGPTESENSEKAQNRYKTSNSAQQRLQEIEPPQATLVKEGSSIEDLRSLIQGNLNTRIPDAVWQRVQGGIPNIGGLIVDSHCLSLTPLIEPIVAVHTQTVRDMNLLPDFIPFYAWVESMVEQKLVARAILDDIKNTYMDLSLTQYFQATAGSLVNREEKDCILYSKTAIHQFKESMEQEFSDNLANYRTFIAQDRPDRPDITFLTQISSTENHLSSWQSDRIHMFAKMHDPDQPIYIVNSFSPDYLSLGIRGEDLPLILIKAGTNREQIGNFLETLIGNQKNSLHENEIYRQIDLSASENQTDTTSVISLADLRKQSLIMLFNTILNRPALVEYSRAKGSLEASDQFYGTCKQEQNYEQITDHFSSTQTSEKVGDLLNHYAERLYYESLKTTFEASKSPKLLLASEDLGYFSQRVLDNLDTLLKTEQRSRSEKIAEVLFSNPDKENTDQNGNDEDPTYRN